MTIEHNPDLVKEWRELHGSHEQYEHYALMIKLVAVVLTVFLIAFTLPKIIILLILAVLWLQEGIWKTYQARTNTRKTLIEKTLLHANNGDTNSPDTSNTVAFQFYHQWSENRSSTLTLIKEYLKNSVKPTVIYPYVPLMIVALIA